MPAGRPRKSMVAVDGGTGGVRAVQLVLDGGRVRVAHWVDVDTYAASGAAAAGSASGDDGGAALARALDAVIEQFGTHRIGLVTAPGNVEYCLLEVPPMLWSRGEKDVTEAIRWEVGQQLRWSVEEAELAAWPLPVAMKNGANAVAVAARRTGIASVVEAIETRHIECEHVEPAANALIRACRASLDAAPEPIWAVLDLGCSGSRLYVAVDDVPVYSREIRGSGREWTRLIARELRIPEGLAEQYKRRYGIGSAERGCRSAGGLERLSEAALPGVLLSVLKRSLQELAADVERAYRFVMEQYPQRQVRGLVLAGGGSRMPGLSAWIGEALGIHVAQARADNVLDVSSSHPLGRPAMYALMAGCVGLALGEIAS